MTGKTLFSRKEIAIALNNAVVSVMKPQTGEFKESHLRWMREYSQALMEIPLEHAEKGWMRYEELAAILTMAAYYIHLRYVAGTDKLPMGAQTVEMMTPPRERRRKESFWAILRFPLVRGRRPKVELEGLAYTKEQADKIAGEIRGVVKEGRFRDEEDSDV